MAKALYQMTIHELHGLLKEKKVSSREITQAVYQRIDAVEPRVHAYITLTREAALKQAAAADEQIRQGLIQPLTGIPLAIKDMLCTAGIPHYLRLKDSSRISFPPMTQPLSAGSRTARGFYGQNKHG